jgi:hypothetical protein
MADERLFLGVRWPWGRILETRKAQVTNTSTPNIWRHESGDCMI